MLNLSAPTRLSAGEVMSKAHEYFVDKQGLEVIERVKHLHGSEGVVEISVGGATVAGDKPYDSQTVFTHLTDYAENRYGLTPVYVLLHLHVSHKDDPGHLLVQANFGDPVEVRIETQEYEFQAKEFMASLPR